VPAQTWKKNQEISRDHHSSTYVSTAYDAIYKGEVVHFKRRACIRNLKDSTPASGIKGLAVAVNHASLTSTDEDFPWVRRVDRERDGEGDISAAFALSLKVSPGSHFHRA
jgi:hypothetical protein